MSRPHVVITTIQAPTASVRALQRRLVALGDGVEGAAGLLIVGDHKGPSGYDVDASELLTIDSQRELPFGLARLLPEGHYCRKNLGYLVAQHRGSPWIYETDDDNAPLPSWQPRSLHVSAGAIDVGGWLNVYQLYSDELIWPRGFPLASIRNDGQPTGELAVASARTVEAPIQQGLANGAADVDAIWRLVLDRDIVFRDGPSVVLEPRTWCPFNSQSTWWWPSAYALMYLPSYCSFRMTDIWRSFIAQRCVWEMGHGIVFHNAEVLQERNVHDLMRDFRDELPGYTRNEELVTELESLKLDAGASTVVSNLRRCYRHLVELEFFPHRELELVEAWIADLP